MGLSGFLSRSAAGGVVGYFLTQLFDSMPRRPDALDIDSSAYWFGGLAGMIAANYLYDRFKWQAKKNVLQSYEGRVPYEGELDQEYFNDGLKSGEFERWLRENK